MTIKDTVNANLDTLRTLDQRQLTAWAKDNGMDSRAGFANFKKALKAAGIDYDAMRTARIQGEAQERAEAITHKVTLYSDAKCKNNRFGITDKDGNPVWHGIFFDNENVYREQSAQEMAAAQKAVWLAGKIKDELNLPAIGLALYVDAEWLTFANCVNEGSKNGGKARKLAEMANKYGVLLEVRYVKGTSNPADYYTTCKGFQKYSEYNIKSLAEVV